MVIRTKEFLIITFFNYSFILGSFLTLLVLLCALSLSAYTLRHENARRKVQNVLLSIVAVKLENSNKPPDDEGHLVAPELDNAIESFLKKIVENFVNSWYSTITQDETFVWNIKVEVAEILRKLALRLRNVRKKNCFIVKIL